MIQLPLNQKNKTLFFFIFLIIFSLPGMRTAGQPRDVRVMFYNAENFFDTRHDTLKEDQEFLPQGAKFWTEKKYKEKVYKTGKVILAVGGWEPPAVVGLCEVENRRCMEDLVNSPVLRPIGYKIVHKGSPDRRGIDVAMLYRPEKFELLAYNYFPVRFSFAPEKRTREILWAKGRLASGDTLHLFFNHWPSRWGGQLESEPRRLAAATALRQAVDSVFLHGPRAHILIMGDLNDYPHNKSLTGIMQAHTNFDNPQAGVLYNIAHYQQQKGHGSNKYQGKWGVLDQTLISGTLLQTDNPLHTSLQDAHIFNAGFLLEQDEKYTGNKPFRTYIGYKYNGGFSDHLPVFIDLTTNIRTQDP